MKDNNDSLPSIDDALKDFDETVSNINKTVNNQEPVKEGNVLHDVLGIYSYLLPF